MKKTHTRHITSSAIALAFACAFPQPSQAKGPAGLSDAAQREIARRMALVQDADLAEARGDAAMAEDDCLTAQDEYNTALGFLPDVPATREKRNRVAAKYADATVCVAKKMAEEGRYDEARANLELALAFDPDHPGANELMRKLDDPGIYPPARTPEHVANVQSVQRLLIEARSSWELGKFDEAEKTYEQVLRIDPYNSTARRGMTRVSQSRSDYYKDAYPDRRAAALAEVEAMWERPVPVLVSRDGMGGAGRPVTDLRDQITARLRNIIIPEVQFVDATIEEAVEFLRFKSAELDTVNTDPARRGVNILINSAGMDVATTPRITLDLKQVPLEEALRYVTELAGMRYKVEAYAVMVVPASDTGTNEMFVRTFTSVPPDFLSGGGGGGGAAPVDLDPFAPQPGGGGGGGGLVPQPTAQDVLMGVGVTFPPGSSASFNRSTAQLIVRNTQPNLDVIEAYVDARQGTQPKMIYLTTKFIEVSQKDTDELGFDWLVGAFGMGGSNSVYGSGGTIGNSLAGGIDGVDFPFVPPVPPGSQGLPVGRNPLTRGLRSGSNAITPDSIDGLLRGTALASGTAPGIFALAGIFTDPEFQMVIRALNQRKGADLMSAPSVTTRSGQRATIEIIREFIYPTEFDPPEIPQTFGGGNLGGGGGGGIIPGLNLAQVSSFPVTPSTPVAFEMRPVGVTMEVDPVLGDDGFTIDLNLAPEVVEFEGFINYGSPIQAGAVDALGNPTTVTLTENRIEQPVFATRKVTTAVTIWDGQTVGLGGLIREDVQSVHDKVPFLGDLPLIGRLFQSKSEDHFKRNLMIFVTARLIGPDGQPLSVPEETGEAPRTPATGVGAGPVSPLMPQGPIDMGDFK